MSTLNSKHIWGQDVERLIHWAPNMNKRTIIRAETLMPNKSVVYIERGNNSFTGKIQTIEIPEREGPETVGYITLATPKGKTLTIPCHLESIPYGFDEPDRYELVIDKDITTIKVLVDYDERRQNIEKRITS